jgi:hypothetical protein
MKTKELSALEVWALAMDFGPPATPPVSTQTIDATQSAHEGVVSPAVTPLDVRGRVENALPREATGDGMGDCGIISEEL